MTLHTECFHKCEPTVKELTDAAVSGIAIQISDHGEVVIAFFFLKGAVFLKGHCFKSGWDNFSDQTWY